MQSRLLSSDRISSGATKLDYRFRVRIISSISANLNTVICMRTPISVRTSPGFALVRAALESSCQLKAFLAYGDWKTLPQISTDSILVVSQEKGFRRRRYQSRRVHGNENCDQKAPFPSADVFCCWHLKNHENDRKLRKTQPFFVQMKGNGKIVSFVFSKSGATVMFRIPKQKPTRFGGRQDKQTHC